MIHSCRIHCYSIDADKAELMGIKDQGKWLPFVFLMDIVVGCKMTSDDPSEPFVGCTTIFTEQGETYIIDTPYERFFRKFQKYYAEEQEDPATPDL